MPRFRKKPVVIEAEQLTQALMDAALLDGAPLPAGVVVASAQFHKGNRTIAYARFVIRTLEGSMEVSPGDWVITGVNGERYPCKPDIFAATYEPAEPTP